MSPAKINLVNRKNIKAVGGYSLFFAVIFVLMLFWTFPYQLVFEIIVAQAKKSNVGITYGSVSPGLFSVKAKSIAITLLKDGGTETKAIPIDEISVRPSLFPLGVTYQAKLFGGSAEGSCGLFGKSMPLVLKAKGLDMALANSKEAIGVDLMGKISAKIDLILDQDNTKTTGTVSIEGEGLMINGGTVAQFDLPKVDLGRLQADLKLDRGKAIIDSFKSEGADAESNLDGEITLASKMPLSGLKLKMKFKLSDEFLKRNPFIQAGMTMAMNRDPKGFYTANIDRVLGNPRWVPVK